MNPLDPFRDSLILTGPTASGKTALALDLAERLNAEIISMDSMTFYRGMDIGTAKPTVIERDRVPHHLIDVLDPWESANVAWWLREAEACCHDIEHRGKQVLFVGGTPFYLKTLLHGLFEGPPVDLALRKRLEEEAAAVGPLVFHAQVAEVDPVSAKRLHPNDTRRLVRALEIWHQTGKPLSQLQQQNWWGGEPAASTLGTEPSPSPRCLVIDLPREDLYARIDKRVEHMIRSGWLDEVRRLRSLSQPLGKEPSQALGYREIAAFLDGFATLKDTISVIQMRTRQFAKRQLTWFRSLRDCRFVEGSLTFDLWHRKMS